MLRAAQYEVVDFGDEQQKPDDDYPHFVVPRLVRLLAAKWIEVWPFAAVAWVPVLLPTMCPARGLAIHESFSARQRVEDNEIRVICLGGRVVANTFLGIGRDLSRRTIQRRRASPAAFGKSCGLESREART